MTKYTFQICIVSEICMTKDTVQIWIVSEIGMAKDAILYKWAAVELFFIFTVLLYRNMLNSLLWLLQKNGVLGDAAAAWGPWEALRVVMNLQVPREALEFARMSINFCSGKFGYSICPIFSKGHAEIFREF